MKKKITFIQQVSEILYITQLMECVTLMGFCKISRIITKLIMEPQKSCGNTLLCHPNQNSHIFPQEKSTHGLSPSF